MALMLPFSRVIPLAGAILPRIGSLTALSLAPDVALLEGVCSGTEPVDVMGKGISVLMAGGLEIGRDELSALMSFLSKRCIFCSICGLIRESFSKPVRSTYMLDLFACHGALRLRQFWLHTIREQDIVLIGEGVE